MAFRKLPVEKVMDELGGYVGLRNYAVVNLGHKVEMMGCAMAFSDALSEWRKTSPGIVSDGVSHTNSSLHALGFVLENAAYHGNNYDPNVILSVKLIECRRGCILRIRDSGKGFDPEEKFRQMKRGEVYYKRAGIGIAIMSANGAELTYEDRGTTWNLIFRR